MMPVMPFAGLRGTSNRDDRTANQIRVARFGRWCVAKGNMMKISEPGPRRYALYQSCVELDWLVAQSLGDHESFQHVNPALAALDIGNKALMFIDPRGKLRLR